MTPSNAMASVWASANRGQGRVQAEVAECRHREQGEGAEDCEDGEEFGQSCAVLFAHEASLRIGECGAAVLRRPRRVGLAGRGGAGLRSLRGARLARRTNFSGEGALAFDGEIGAQAVIRLLPEALDPHEHKWQFQQVFRNEQIATCAIRVVRNG